MLEDTSVDDDKKQFDAEGLHEEETQPDPDEQLMLDQGNGRVWLVKVCPTAISSNSHHLAYRFRNILWSAGPPSTSKTST